MRYVQLVVGTAGSGKSTYCKAMQEHIIHMKREVEIINLDPGAESFDYEPFADIRELINIEDAMEDEELNFGPNGGLVFCMEYLLENVDWLKEKLGDNEDDYFLFDCPGQIELYTHLPAMTKLVDLLKKWDFSVCTVFLMDVQFMTDGPKFISGTMAVLSTLAKMETPHISILSKMDLLSKATSKRIDRFLDPDTDALLEDFRSKSTSFSEKRLKLSEAVADIINDFALVSFVPLNLNEEDSLMNALFTIDTALGYGENEDVKTKDFEEEDED